MKLRHLSLFSGVGGFDLAAEWAGWENVAHCEWNEFCRKVLNYYWPDAMSFGDIHDLKFDDNEKYKKNRELIGTVDVVSGGFP